MSKFMIRAIKDDSVYGYEIGDVFTVIDNKFYDCDGDVRDFGCDGDVRDFGCDVNKQDFEIIDVSSTQISSASVISGDWIEPRATLSPVQMKRTIVDGVYNDITVTYDNDLYLGVHKHYATADWLRTVAAMFIEMAEVLEENE